MSYSNAIFFLDPESGSDSARADLVPTAYANNGSGLVRVTCNSTAAYSTGAVFDVAGTTGSVYVGGWLVTIIDGTHVDLQGSTFTSNPAAKGTLIPRGGSSKSDAWKTITSGVTVARVATTDVVRIKGSLDKTSMAQNGTWAEAGPNNTTYAIVSSTNATPIVVKLSGANYALLAPVAGDTLIVNAHTTNTKANGVWEIGAVDGVAFTVSLINADGSNSVGNGVGGASGTIRKINNLRVKLASAITKAIALIGNQGTKTNWTPITVPGVNTCSVITSDFKEGGECQQIGIAAAHVTGNAAYFATGTLDLSSYQQTTFWVKQTSGTVAIAGDASIRLCTDTAGATSVHTAAIPALGALNRWVPVTVDSGGALNSAIASVALYIDTDRGAQTFQLDCIAACKASSSGDSLSLTSLIGKNTGNEPWCQIQSINSTRVMLDGLSYFNFPGSSPQRGYSGTAETVTTYKRETIKLGSSSTLGTVAVAADFEGGWDRTNMTTQNIETFFDGVNCAGTGLSGTAGTVNKLHYYRFARGIIPGVATVYSGTIYVGSNDTGGIAATAGAAGFTFSTVIGYGDNNTFLANTATFLGATITTLFAIGNIASGWLISASGLIVTNVTVGTLNTWNCGSAGMSSTSLGAYGNTYGTVTTKFNNGSGANFAGVNGTANNKIISLTSSSNTTYGLDLTEGGLFVGGGSTTSNGSGGVVSETGGNNGHWNPTTLRNFTVNETTKVTAPQLGFNIFIAFENYAGTVGDHRIFTDGGGSTTLPAISQQTAIKHGSDNYGWKYSPTSATRNASYPLEQIIARIAVAANALVTVSRWAQRDNTGLTLRLVCKGGQLNGVASDVIISASAAINTWEQLTITFTPTEIGVIEITEQTWGGVNLNGYTSDLSVSQA